MDDDWQATPFGDAQLFAKVRLLDVGTAEVIVIVEADLTDGDDVRKVGKFLHTFHVGHRHFAGIVGMDSDTGTDAVIEGRRLQNAMPRARFDRRNDDAREPGIPCALEQGRTIVVERFGVDMGMRIDHASAPRAFRALSTVSACFGVRTLGKVFTMMPSGFTM